MRFKSKDMQRKFEEYESERNTLQEENQSMKTFKTDSEQLVKERQAYQEASKRCESLTAQLSTLKQKFDEQLVKLEAHEITIKSQMEKLSAFEQKTLKLQTD